MKVLTAELVISAAAPRQFLRGDLPEVAFVGRSNVGKSSLMNRLLGRNKLARTSRTPGRTQMVTYFLINRKWHFVDLPGYGFAKASYEDRRRWAALMDSYFRHRREGGKLLVHLVDAKVGATDLDVEARRYFADLGLSTLVVATKVDKVPRSRHVRAVREIRQALELPEEQEIVPFSSTSGEGVKQLWKGISAFLDPPGEALQAGKP